MKVDAPQFGPTVQLSCHHIACEVTATPIASNGWRITRDGMSLGTVIQRGDGTFAAYKDFGKTRVGNPFDHGDTTFVSLADAAEALVVAVC